MPEPISTLPAGRLRSDPARKIGKIASALLDWFATQARDLPWRRTQDPYAIWISETMLQQTQVKTVIPYWQRWLRELPTLAALAAAPPEKVLKLWEGLGYYSRARNLQKAAQWLVAEGGGRFPNKFDDVLALPGVGRYTAGAICSIAFNQPTPLLDGNVVRVLTRLFGIRDDPLKKTTNNLLWQLAGELVRHANSIPPRTGMATPKAGVPLAGNCSQLNQSLMELGALVCTPRQPRCELCPVNQTCAAWRTDLVALIPTPRPRPTITHRRCLAFVVEQRGRFLVRQRSSGTVNGLLWEFPNLDLNGEPLEPAALAKSLLGVDGKLTGPLYRLTHSITRYRIQLDVFHLILPVRAKSPAGTWMNLAALPQLAFASAHKKILQLLLAGGPGGGGHPCLALSRRVPPVIQSPHA